MTLPIPAQRLSTRAVRIVAIGLTGWLVFLCVTALRDHSLEKDRGSLSRVVETLMVARQTLASIRATTGSYPGSDGQWLAMTPLELDRDLRSGGGKKGFADGFHPWSGKPERTVLYRSDGKDYKLILHKTGGCTAVHAGWPDLADPARTVYSRSIIVGGWEVTSPDEAAQAKTRPPVVKFDPETVNPLFGECWAYGIWTEGARFW